MAADPVLLDTSLIVAVSLEFHPGHQAALQYLARLELEKAALCISPQICREFLVVLTRKPIGGRTFTVVEALDVLAKWRRACTLLEEDEAVVEQWLRLVEEHEVKGKQVHDANIVAVMLSHGVTRLGTRNAADFERYLARYGDRLQLEPVSS